MNKILIAEDDKFLVNAYRVKLTKSGFDVKIALDGEEVFEILKTFTPDIILLDLVMSKKDGFTVLEDLGKNEKYKGIPVLVASNLGQAEDIERAKKLGAKDFIVKSNMSLEDILTKIKSYL